MFLALQRVLLKQRFYGIYRFLPIFSILPSYQYLLKTDHNYDQHWLLYLEVFTTFSLYLDFNDNFYKKSLPIINLYIFPITLIDLHNNMTINICSVYIQVSKTGKKLCYELSDKRNGKNTYKHRKCVCRYLARSKNELDYEKIMSHFCQS